ncbi:MAG: hypothetical protein MHM6MM_000178 [Cercozoa sp. M6MM]
MQMITTLLQAQSALQRGASGSLSLLEDGLPPCVTAVLSQKPYVDYMGTMLQCSDLFGDSSGYSVICDAQKSRQFDGCFDAVMGLVRSDVIQEIAESCSDSNSTFAPSDMAMSFGFMKCSGEFIYDVLTTSRDTVCARNSTGGFCLDAQQERLPLFGMELYGVKDSAMFASELCGDCNREMIKSAVAISQSTEDLMQCVSSVASDGIVVTPPVSIPSGVNTTKLRQLALTVDSLCNDGCLDTMMSKLGSGGDTFNVLNSVCDDTCLADTFVMVAELGEDNPPVGAAVALELLCQKDANNTRCLHHLGGAPTDSCCYANEEASMKPFNRSSLAEVCTPLYTSDKKVAGRLVLRNVAFDYAEERVDELRHLVARTLGAPVADVSLEVRLQHGLVTLVFEVRLLNDARAQRYVKAAATLSEIQAFAELTPASGRPNTGAQASLDVSLSATAECSTDDDCEAAQTVPEDVPSAATSPLLALSAAAGALVAMQLH